MDPVTKTIAVRCPACQSGALVDLGQLPHRDGLLLLQTPGRLYRCGVCQLLFRSPYPSDAELAEGYSALSDDNWVNNRARRDFTLAARIISTSLEHGRVLDVGCFRGDFLGDYLPRHFRKFGVEPSRDARKLAQQRGICVIADTIADIPAISPCFDAICLMDVIEHLRDPLQALAKLSSLLLPGGILLVSTGDASFPIWRLLGTDYYYHYYEHVSFLTKRWFEWASSRLGLEILSVNHFAHGSASLGRQAKELCACCLRLGQRYLVQQSRFPRLGERYPFSLCSRVSAYGLPSLPDHFMVTLRAAGKLGTTER